MNKIKVIFWDLDNTLWKGIIAEGIPEPNEELFKMIYTLNKRGIVSSIVSHNEFKVPERFLKDLGYWDRFVFPKISWAKKSPQILKTLDQMHLRAENALFIDDRQHNLDEAKFFIPEINVLNPLNEDLLSVLRDVLIRDGKEDPNLSRFNQYKILETKTEDIEKEYIGDGLAFLIQSKICVTFEDCASNIDRIHELVSRTNQLNYTKSRDSKEELKELITNPRYESLLISVKDRYGGYGIVGFAVFNNEEVKHFVFSCRILNMGVESFVFHKFKVPAFNIIEDVAYTFSDSMPYWIDIYDYKKEDTFGRDKIMEGKALLVGGCDLSQMLPFLKGSFDTHFNYVSESNSKLEVHRDSIDFLLSKHLSKEQINFITATCPFVDKKCFNTPDFRRYKTVVYSPLIDYVQGKYVSKLIKSFYVSCNPFLRDGVLDGSKINFINRTKGITRDQAVKFHVNWKYSEKPNLFYIEQLRQFFDKLKKARVFVLLGATTTYSDLDEDRFEKHMHMNSIIENVAAEYNNISLLYPDKYLKQRSDFTNSIRHYTKHIYHALAVEMQEKLNKQTIQ